MHPLLRKLNFKDQRRLLVLSAPPDLAETIEAMGQDVALGKRLGKAEPFVLVFVHRRADIASRVPRVVAALADDALLWFAYPKKSSKRYDSDISRDGSWGVLGEHGFEGVRQIAIDADWSALRFRAADRIATMKRDPKRAMSTTGKARARAAQKRR